MQLDYLAVYDRKRDCGVYHKIIDQLKGFELSGIHTNLIKVGQWVSQVSVLGKTIDVVYYNWLSLEIEDDVDVLYIRYQRSDFNFLRFLRRFKKGRKGRKIIIEIATYPYEQEDGKGAALTRLNDRICRKFLKYYVDRIVAIAVPNELLSQKG